MEEKQVLFNQYIEEYKKLTTIKKCEELIEKEKKIISYLAIFAAKNNGQEIELLKSRKIKDLFSEPTIDDYLEAMMVYTQDIEEVIGQILKQNIILE